MDWWNFTGSAAYSAPDSSWYTGSSVSRISWETIDYILEVKTLVPDRLMIMESVKSPFPMRVTYRFEPQTSSTTLAQVTVEGTATGYYKIADFLMAPMIRRNLNKDLKRLRTILEKQ